MPQRLTTEEFIQRAREVHGDKYDYSKVEYKNSSTKICIICKTHGEFWQTPNSHLRGNGCPDCYGNKKKDTALFIEDARMIHGDRYDYSKTHYTDALTPVKIICPKHGAFFQKPNSHLSGCGCRDCGYERNSQTFKKTTQDFIAEAIAVHGDKYKYEKVNYVDATTPVCIICPTHGEFMQMPYVHLQGHGCTACGYERISDDLKHTTDEFIAQAIEIHGDKYGYDKTNYVSNKNPVIITCRIHGDFLQKPLDHLAGCGCQKCGKESSAEKMKIPFNEFVRRANIVHNNKYIYIEDKYKNGNLDIYAVCPIHGGFYQSYGNHLTGYGCPYCNESHGEREIAKWLDSRGVQYKRQYIIIPEQVLFGRNKFRADFYLPDHNTIIEFNGKQHYEYSKFYHRTEEDFVNQQDRDQRLRVYCKKNKIRLIEIPYTDFNNIEKILSKKLSISKIK